MDDQQWNMKQTWNSEGYFWESPSMIPKSMMMQKYFII